MQARGRHALFHAIVTMGAASVQGGCGGVTTDTTARGANAAGGTGSQGDASGLGSAGTGTSVASGGAILTTYGQGGSVSAPPIATAIREAGPPPRIYDAGSATACSHTEQFQCDVWDPVPQGCRCDENGPISNADCFCGGMQCHSYAPQVGCYCVICIH